MTGDPDVSYFATTAPLGSAPCLDPSQTHGFLIDEAEVTFWGLSPAGRIDGNSNVDERTAAVDDSSTPRNNHLEGAA